MRLSKTEPTVLIEGIIKESLPKIPSTSVSLKECVLEAGLTLGGFKIYNNPAMLEAAYWTIPPYSKDIQDAYKRLTLQRDEAANKVRKQREQIQRQITLSLIGLKDKELAEFLLYLPQQIKHMLEM